MGAEASSGRVTFGVLGPVVAWDADGVALDLKGPRHRAVLARLAVARGRVVPLGVLIEDLWETPPAGAIRTFVGALRRSVEPGRPPQSGFRILVTQGPGYALRAGPDDLDALRFEKLAAGAAAAPPPRALELSDESLALWRGPAYAGFAGEPWASGDCARLTELRLGLIERQAEARLALGRAAQAVPDLQALVSGQPWREEAWRLLALALYRCGRQAEALDVIGRAKSLLAAELGLDLGPSLAALETSILRHEAHLDLPADDVLTATTAAYQRTARGFTRTRLESAATLAGSLALAGGPGLQAAMSQRLAAIEAAEQIGDPGLTARVIANFDVPAIWPRSDDPAAAERIVTAAERTLTVLPAGRDPLRPRLLATIALESRGGRDGRAGQAAAEAETIARRLGDPALLAFALNGVWMQTFWRTGLAARRDAIGGEIVALATRHGLVSFEVLGRLIRLQALSGLGDFRGADTQAAVLDQLAELHERPLAGLFTSWYRALRAAATADPAATTDPGGAEERYRQAATLLDGAGMPGVEHGLLALAQLCLRVWRREPASFPDGTDWGPYHAWARPWLLLARGDSGGASRALRSCPAPPPGLLAEALWCLTARAAVILADRAVAATAHEALLPAAGEIADAASGMLTAGPVSDYLAELEQHGCGAGQAR
ncbi:MAG: BTAD domain-containing putative transcriptional regulator [Streptosporangiaceae bacterium]